MSSSNALFIAPKIGCKHFKSVVKDIRAENNTFESALTDIIDNTYGISKSLGLTNALCNIKITYSDGNPYKITISDNIPHGFINILESGINNPLNMGHIRLGHDDDNESSEFGTGMKKALIFLSQMAVIYTRSVRENGATTNVKVTFEVPMMCEKISPEDSYEPSGFEIISEETYKNNHIYDTGSSIILSNLKVSDFTYNKENGRRLSQEEFEDTLNKKLGETYSELISNNIITIILNDNIVKPQINLITDVHIPVSNKIIYEFYNKLNHNNECIDIYRIGNTPTGRQDIKRYDSNESKFKKESADEFLSYKNTGSVYKLILTSLTTKNTPHQNIVPGDITDIVRDGRCFGQTKITKQEKDGYSNHIYNRIYYVSKKLNSLVGVGSNKRVDIKSNILMTAIHITQKETTKKWRKYCKGDNFDNSSSSEESIVSVPSIIRPKINKSKIVKTQPVPETVVPETVVPESETVIPETVVSETVVSETVVSETVVSETVVSENVVPESETVVSETVVPETVVSETVVPETVVPESVVSETVSLHISESVIVQESFVIQEQECDILESSRENIRQSARLLMELIADPNFNRLDGRLILESVNKYIQL
jgi:hypothetical protein